VKVREPTELPSAKGEINLPVIIDLFHLMRESPPYAPFQRGQRRHKSPKSCPKQARFMRELRIYCLNCVRIPGSGWIG